MQTRGGARWTPAVIAGGVFAAVVASIAFAGGGKSSGEASATLTQSVADAGVLTSQTALTAPLTTPVPETAATVPRTPLDRTLGKGMTGDDVRMVQQRLIDLHFDPGPVDGVYGTKTIQSVWAFEKLVLHVPPAKIKGRVTPETWDVMEGPVAIGPRRTGLSTTHFEVYLPEQVAVLFKDDLPILVTHISTGTGEEWKAVVTIDPGEVGNEKGTEPIKEGIIGTAITPGGTFTFDRRYVDGDGWREGKLGRMYKPVYFDYGLAVHGSGSVPDYPASHGCVRLPMHIAEYFPTLVKRGDWIYIWDGKKEPEAYGHQPAPFDRRDPDFTQPSTTPPSTSSPAKSTTTGPGTTKPEASTTTTTTTTTTAGPQTTSAPATTSSGGAGGAGGGGGVP